jgi:hypothetical protein
MEVEPKRRACMYCGKVRITYAEVPRRVTPQAMSKRPHDEDLRGNRENEAKKPYARPVFVEYGEIAKLTFGGTGSIPDVMTGMNQPM